MQDNADPILLGEHDVALASIEKVVAGEENVVPTFWSVSFSSIDYWIIVFICCSETIL